MAAWSKNVGRRKEKWKAFPFTKAPVLYKQIACTWSPSMKHWPYQDPPKTTRKHGAGRGKRKPVNGT